MSTKKPMLIVTDDAGNIVAASHADPPAQKGIHVGLSPRPGQHLHRIDVPEEITRLTSGHDFHQALSGLLITPQPAEAAFRQVVVKRKEEQHKEGKKAQK